MDNQQALTVVDTLVFTKKGKYLSDIQRLLLNSSLSDQRLRYDDIAKHHGYSLNYLKQDVGPKLWQMLSDVCGEKVSKTNFRSALERQWDRAILDPIEVTIPTTIQTESIAVSTPAVPVVAPIVPTRHLDWGDAPDVAIFYNRTQELATLSRWIVTDGCRLVVVSGMGGIGKTHLSIKLAEQIQPHFQYVIWRSLVPATPLSELVIDLLKSLTQGTEVNLQIGLEDQILMLIHILKKSKCLLILDNAETLLESGVLAGQYQANYQNYQTFFQRIGTCQHQSCVLLTTREQPQEITLMQGDTLPVRSLKLAGLNVESGQKILQSRGCFVESAGCLQLAITKYGGNPLLLKIVSAIASELYNGNISEFIQSRSSIYREIGDVLDQQLDRLRDSEKSFLYWLTIEQKPLDWVELNSGNYPGILPEAIIETVRSLLHRSLIEKQNRKFCLQPVVKEYLQHKAIDQIIAEIESENLLLLDHYPLQRSTATEDLKQTQSDLIIKPLLDRLLIIYKTPAQIRTKLQKILANLQTEQTLEPGYGSRNIINLLDRLQMVVVSKP
jgi:siroheme synthase (precorrin-2 oxidase/ferrochelatase)